MEELEIKNELLLKPKDLDKLKSNKWRFKGASDLNKKRILENKNS